MTPEEYPDDQGLWDEVERMLWEIYADPYGNVYGKDEFLDALKNKFTLTRRAASQDKTEKPV